MKKIKKLLFPAALFLIIGCSSYAMKDPQNIIKRVKSGIKSEEIRFRKRDDGMCEYFVEKDDLYIGYIMSSMTKRDEGHSIVELAGKSIKVPSDYARRFPSSYVIYRDLFPSSYKNYRDRKDLCIGVLGFRPGVVGFRY